MTPSRAGMSKIGGSINGTDASSGAGEVVTRFPSTYSSGGFVTYDQTPAIVFPSGDATAAYIPTSFVSRTRAPPSTGIRQKCCSYGEVSLVVRKNDLPSRESATLSTSHFPLVSAFAGPPLHATVDRWAHPVASETNQTRALSCSQ